MTTTDTEDIQATIEQSAALAEAGCDIVRITAPTLRAARALKEIKAGLLDRKIETPIVADIHFLPKAAMEAVEHVEKVRINPGNYADRKKFKVKEYSDDEYEAELERLHEAFSPIVLRCKELGKAMRIGTNHGSLSDRIMNRYGDTPLGMVESALEFIRIAESHNYRDIVLSMKASNPKVMIQAYRLVVARMLEEDMHYPLHLGVTEAGDGEDARVKSAIGIGSLLADGLGDTIRVSLTEDPIYEVPVARQLVAWAAKIQKDISPTSFEEVEESLNPYEFEKRKIESIELNDTRNIETDSPPFVAIKAPEAVTIDQLAQQTREIQVRQKDAPVEFLIIDLAQTEDWTHIQSLADNLKDTILGLIIDCRNIEAFNEAPDSLPDDLKYIVNIRIQNWINADKVEIPRRFTLSLDFSSIPEAQSFIGNHIDYLPDHFIVTSSQNQNNHSHSIGLYRKLVVIFEAYDKHPAFWLRNTRAHYQLENPHFAYQLLDSSILSGSLICDGIGNLISVETEPNLLKATALAYNILQGARARISKTEFVACPSCGRTLFDLQSTTQKIRGRTDHLKGVTIAIMGCIVNGPGEMADADFGYVGGAPGKVNLYVGKKCVKVGIPEAEALDRLVDLIREHGKWVEPEVQEV